MTAAIKIKIPDTVIGIGAINDLGEIAAGFKADKSLILTDAGIVKAGIIESVKGPLDRAGQKYEIFDGCKEEPPIPLMAEIAGMAREGDYDLLIGVGGGSVMDTTKVVSAITYSGLTIQDYIDTPFHNYIEGRMIPKVLVPTTSGTGSEWSIVTPLYAHDEGREYVVQAWQNTADKVIVDPELTVKMPQRLTADTGMDALTHAIEAYASPAANVFSDMLAATAIKLIAENLRPAYAKGGQNIEARYNMSVAASFAMNAVVSAGIGLSHIINHYLGPMAHVSHGTAVTLTLPAVMGYNMISNPAKFASIAAMMGENVSGLSKMDAAMKSVEAVRRLIKDINMPQRLSEVGITEADIPRLAGMCSQIDQPLIDALNPRDATEKDIITILKASL